MKTLSQTGHLLHRIKMLVELKNLSKAHKKSQKYAEPDTKTPRRVIIKPKAREMQIWEEPMYFLSVIVMLSTFRASAVATWM